MSLLKPTILLSLFNVVGSIGLAQTVPTDNNQTKTSIQKTASQVSPVQFTFFEKGTGQPIKRVEVRFNKIMEYSDASGNLSINLPINEQGNIIITRRRYESVTLEIKNVLAQKSLEIYLIPAVSEDSLIYIKGQRKTTVSRKTVKKEEAIKIAPSGDPAQIIKLLPGVQSQSFSPQVVVRGSGPQDSKYYIDNIEVPYIFHFIGGLSLVPSLMLDEVQFDSGGFGAEYGDATGGVIVLKTKSQIPERNITRFIFNTPLYSGVSHERSLTEDSALYMSYRKSYIDAFLKAAIKQREKQTGKSTGITIVPFFSDGHLSYFKKLQKGYSKSTFIASEEGIKAAIPLDLAASADGTSSIYSNVRFATIAHEVSNKFSTDWSYKSTPQASHAIQTSDFFGNKVNIKTTAARIPTEFNKKLNKNDNLNLGFDPFYLHAEVDIYSILPNFEDPTFDPEDAEKIKAVEKNDGQSLSAWTDIDFSLDSIKVTPGIRGTYDDQIKRHIFSPRFRMQWSADDSQLIKLALGQYEKAPEFNESGTASLKAERRLQFEKSYHYILGLNSRWNDYWQSEIQIFYKETKNSIRPDSVYYYNNNGSAISRGIEFFIRRNLTSRLFGWLSYTYSKTEQRDSDDETFQTSPYDQPHVLNFAGNYKINGTWDIGSRYAFASGNVYTPIRKAVYNSYLDKYQPREDESDINSARLPNSNLFTVYANHDFLFNSWKMSLKFGVESYSFEKPIQGMGYNFDYSEEEPQEGVPFNIPFFRIKR
ncbi:MAG: TonB-dependent receptor [Bdellovibrionota bacterium]